MRLVGRGAKLDDFGVVRNVSLIPVVLGPTKSSIVLLYFLLDFFLNRVKLSILMSFKLRVGLVRLSVLSGAGRLSLRWLG